MKQRLFWKILLGFWITFIGITQGIWLAFTLAHPTGASDFGREIGRIHLVAAATALHYGGQPALDQVVASWLPQDRSALSVRVAGCPPAAGARRPSATTVAETVATPQGRYRLTYDWAPPSPGPFRIPWEVLTLAVLGGLIFSAVLAWYLTWPIRTLSRGFGRLAEGDLSVRLRGGMGRRRDELADLAQDFDLMAERLQQLVSARDRLLHDVSHELRSPLARLQTAIGLARQNPQKLAATLDRIELESRRLDGLVGELLTLARVEGDDPRPDQYFDLVDLVRIIGEDARFEGEQLGIEVEVEGPDGDDAARPTLRGSADLLRRGLENVVRNAIRFSARGQQVRITVRPEASARRYLVRVEDQGPGVPDEALGLIFEPFVRIGGAAPAPGLGLGLAIARRAVLAQGGAISAANRPEGGLRVDICLPFGEAAAAA